VEPVIAFARAATRWPGITPLLRNPVSGDFTGYSRRHVAGWRNAPWGARRINVSQVDSRADSESNDAITGDFGFYR
jgi:hypothetical protein